MTEAAPAPLSPFAVFRNRNFSLMWTGQLISTIGSALTSLAASIYVFRLTNSALSVGLMLIATAAPSLLVVRVHEIAKLYCIWLTPIWFTTS